VPTPIVDLTFPRSWEAEILSARPMILPQHRFVYPREVDEVERGALELLVNTKKTGIADTKRSPDGRSFLATCALGFRDPAVPTGLWSCPKPEELCAVAGGYAYVINTAAPEHFTMIAYRPVLEVRSMPTQSLLLFVGHRSILAWGVTGRAWESENLSDEGIALVSIEDDILCGIGWRLSTDRETSFQLDLHTGSLVTPQP
jgi:hypothetical protein